VRDKILEVSINFLHLYRHPESWPLISEACCSLGREVGQDLEHVLSVPPLQVDPGVLLQIHSLNKPALRIQKQKLLRIAVLTNVVDCFVMYLYNKIYFLSSVFFYLFPYMDEKNKKCNIAK
jgi:hypothetical protein